MTQEDKYENIPSELKDCERWVVQKQKIPYNAITDRLAATNNPKSWSPFRDAVSAMKDKHYDGIGIVLTSEDNFMCIDLDTVRDPVSGKVDPTAERIIEEMNSYTEISQSGYGFHIFAKVDPIFCLERHRMSLPANEIQRSDVHRETGKVIYKKPEIEMYSDKQYIIMTGDVYAGHDSINYATQAASHIYNKYIQNTQMPSTEKKINKTQHRKSTASVNKDIIIASMLNARNGAKAQSLFLHGDTSGYGNDRSKADLALCQIIAFWMPDAKMIDAIFRESKLMRKKWDTLHGAMTYGAMTIKKALETTTQHYLWERYHQKEKPLKKKCSQIKSICEKNNVCFSEMLLKKNALNSPTDYLIKYFNQNLDYQLLDTMCGNTGAAIFVKELMGDIFCYVTETRKWMIYNGVYWEENPASIYNLCFIISDALLKWKCIVNDEWLKKSISKCAKTWSYNKFRQGIVDDLKTLRSVRLGKFDTAKHLFNCKNGTYNLDTMQWQAHNPYDMITKCANVEYSPTVTAEKFEQFLFTTFEGDMEQIDYLQRILGSLLFGDARDECFFVFFGPTRSGKGTLISTIESLMENYSIVMRAETIAVQKNPNGSAANGDLARLRGARAILVNENNQSMPIDSALLKQMTGGDTIVGRKLYQEEIQFRLEGKIIINTNYLPNIDDTTIFASDRMRVVMFKHHLAEEERDPMLKSALKDPQELSGILNFMLKGAEKYKEYGLRAPASNRDSIRKLAHDTDILGMFFEEELEPDDTNDIKASDAFGKYKEWCAARNYNAGNIKLFIQRIENEQHAVIKRNTRAREGDSRSNPTTCIVNFKCRQKIK